MTRAARSCAAQCAFDAPPTQTPLQGCCERWEEDGRAFSPRLPRPPDAEEILREAAPGSCADVLPLLRRAAYDVARVPKVGIKSARELVKRMDRSKGRTFDAPRLHIRVSDGHGYVVNVQTDWVRVTEARTPDFHIAATALTSRHR